MVFLQVFPIELVKHNPQYISFEATSFNTYTSLIQDSQHTESDLHSEDGLIS